MEPVRLDLDHIVISAERLDDGVAFVGQTLGLRMAPGGKHPAMGTHNRLIGLGQTYLEVIAIDPDAPPPAHRRWFGLDAFRGAPRLTNWVARTTDLDAALALAPKGTGTPMRLSRGDLHWTIAVSQDGTLPYDGAFPGLIDWGDAQHPAARLPDAGARLETLQVAHPSGAELRVALAGFAGGLEDHVTEAPRPGFRAVIATPGGAKALA
ncbi:MAG: VOC family protein [Rhodobacteraceae bacterium]|nr:VOC family protein [Paracoccaceae bacterium]